MSKPEITHSELKLEAAAFAAEVSRTPIESLFGVTDGKALGTFIEHKFRERLLVRYSVQTSSSALGIDFPTLGVDVKVTSIRQPQSSCPFKSARQKVYGLGYDLLVFVYDKTDEHAARIAQLSILHVIFIDRARTADFQLTRMLREILAGGANADDILALFADRNLPLDEVQAAQLAADVLANPPAQGYLTISNALQWRLQYQRAVDLSGTIEGLESLRITNA